MIDHLDDLIQRLGPEVLPFGRTEPHRKPAEEEIIDFSKQAYDAINDKPPTPTTHHITIQEIQISGPVEEIGISSDMLTIPNEKMFIWLIYKKNDKLQFRLIPDNTENPEGKNKVGGRPNVCHSNISAGGKALQGGECWWCDETKTMYVNYKSGRYRAMTFTHWNAVIEFFKHVGYSNVVPVNPKGWILQK